jgi:hypothetical protein
MYGVWYRFASRKELKSVLEMALGEATLAKVVEFIDSECV